MFYEQWQMLDTNLADASAKLGEIENALIPNTLADIPFAAFFSIGFSHHIMILSKTKTFTERKYYIQLCADLQLSHEALERTIAEDAYHNQGKMPNNFNNTIPDYKQAFQAIQMFKDSYLLDFINTEQLGLREEDIDERVIENEIIYNIRNFIMTFGKGFAFIGSQVHFDKLGHDHWVDLLFFNRILRSLVVIELKKGSFKPGYLGFRNPNKPAEQYKAAPSCWQQPDAQDAGHTLSTHPRPQGYNPTSSRLSKTPTGRPPVPSRQSTPVPCRPNPPILP